MQMHIVLDEDDGPESAKKAVTLIGLFVGPDVMGKVASEFRAAASSDAVVITPQPEAPPAPSPTAVFGGDAKPELDAQGLPWDARIHSSNHEKTAKNIWTARRNVDDTTKLAVIAELRQRFPEIPAFLDRRQETPAAPPPPTPAAPAAPAAPGALTFVGLMQKITAALTSGKLDRDEVAAACKSAGMDTPAALGQPANAHHIPTVAAYIDAVVMGKP